MQSQNHGTIGPDDLKNITVTTEEIELKLESICASAFRLLKTQLEEKRDALISTSTAAGYIETTSEYYSTKVLRKKLVENCRLALHNPNLEYPLSHIEDELKREYDAVLSDIDNTYQIIRENIKTNIRVAKHHAALLEQKKPPLKMHVEAFKADVIQALQNAAEECFELLTPKGKTWTNNKLEEFIDIFGCVVRVFGSNVHLDKSAAYGLAFGHKLRMDGKLSKTLSLNVIKQMTLDDVQQMIDGIISECQYYYDLKHSYIYDILKIIKKHVEKISKIKEYQGYIEFKETGAIFSYLSEVKLRNEEKIVGEPLKLVKTQHDEIEMKQDGFIAQQIQEVLKPLQTRVETYKNHADETIIFFNTEARSAADYLYSSSTLCNNEIASSISTMQLTNSEAKTLAIATDTATHKVQLAYEGAIKYAKVMDEKEFAKHTSWADESLTVAKAKMLELNSQILALENYRSIIVKKLAIAKELYNGTVYRVLQTGYKREMVRLDDLKARYVHVIKDYNHAILLPKAIEAYGEFHFDCANAKSKIKESCQHVEVISGVLQTLKDTFNALFDEIKTNKEYKLEPYQEKTDVELKKATDALKWSAENIEQANEYRNKAMLKLSKAEEAFPADIRAEHQDSFDILKMRFTEAKMQHDIQEKNLAFMQLFPDVIKDYSAIVLDTLKIQTDAMLVSQSCNQLSVNVDDIQHARLEAENLATAGVVKQSLKILAKAKLKEIAQVLHAAQKTLIHADQIRLEKQKLLLEAKNKYPEEMHSKSQELFDTASNQYALALTDYRAAFKKYMDVSIDVEVVREKLVKAKQVEQDKKHATELRQFLLKTIFMNFALWQPHSRWGGGVNYRFEDLDYRVPHGVYELIMALTNSTDHTQWINKVVSVSAARESLASKWKYHIFHVRNEKTGELYKILKNHLKLDNIQALQQELLKIPGIRMPGIELEEKSRGLVPSV